MKCSPYFKFYAEDFVHGTANLTNEQVGLLTRIMCWQWIKQGDLPSDPVELARTIRQNPRTVRTLLPQLVERGKVELDDRGIRTRRMVQVITEFCNRAQAARVREQAKKAEQGSRSIPLEDIKKDQANQHHAIHDTSRAITEAVNAVRAEFELNSPRIPAKQNQKDQQNQRSSDQKRPIYKNIEEEREERETPPPSGQTLSRQALPSGPTSFRQGSEQSESSAPIVSGPHFNGVGFVVRPGVHIRHETIESWRAQFPNLNIRLKVEQLGMWLGRQAKHDHWGLQHPEDWMRTKLAEEAAQAKAAAKPKMQTFKR